MLNYDAAPGKRYYIQYPSREPCQAGRRKVLDEHRSPIERVVRIGGLGSIAAVCTSGKRPTRETETERELDSAIRDARPLVRVVFNVPCSWVHFSVRVQLRKGAMVFRTVSATAALLISLGASGRKAWAQYYPPVQAYPLPQAYPPQGYYPRQGYRPPVVDDDDDDDMVYDLEGRPLPPGAVAKPQANKPPGGRYRSAGTYRDGRQRGYRDVPQQGGNDYEPYYGVPGGIPPGSAGSAEQDAILREAMRSRPIRPDQVNPDPDDPRVTGSTGGGGDPRNMVAFPPDVRPETGPKKELAPQFRRTLVDYYTKEPAGTIIIDTPNTYLYLVLGNGKALRYGVGVGREGFTWSGVQQVTRMA